MKPGIYTVQSWNGKDAILIGDGGEFITLTKNDFPKNFEGQLFVDEKIEIKTIIVIEPLGGTSLDERCRAARAAEIFKQQMTQKQRDFIAAENERRRKCGVKPLE